MCINVNLLTQRYTYAHIPLARRLAFTIQYVNIY